MRGHEASIAKLAVFQHGRSVRDRESHQKTNVFLGSIYALSMAPICGHRRFQHIHWTKGAATPRWGTEYRTSSVHSIPFLLVWAGVDCSRGSELSVGCIWRDAFQRSWRVRQLYLGCVQRFGGALALRS